MNCSTYPLAFHDECGVSAGQVASEYRLELDDQMHVLPKEV